VRLDQGQAVSEMLLKLAQGWDAPPVPFHCGDLRTGVEQGPGQSCGTPTDLIDPLTFKRSRNGRDPREQLAIEDEILPKRLACAQPVASDHVAQGLRRCAPAVSRRQAAPSPRI